MTHLSRARAEHKKDQELAQVPSLRHAREIMHISSGCEFAKATGGGWSATLP
jgi:hypothetical protein